MSKYLCLVCLLLAVATVNSYFDRPLLSSKSFYSDIHDDSQTSFKLPGQGFVPVKGFVVSRHAVTPARPDKRNRNLGTVARYQQIVKEANTPQINDPEVKVWAEWKPKPIIIDDYNQNLLTRGKEEMRGFAQRLRDGFSALFEAKYDPRVYTVLASAAKEYRYDDDGKAEGQGENRAGASAAVLMEELFPESGYTPETIPKCGLNDILLMNESGRKLDPQNERQKAKEEELKQRFLKSDGLKELGKKLAKKFQIPEAGVDFNFLKASFETCRLNRIFHNDDKHPTCSVFDDNDAKVMVLQDDGFWWAFVDPDGSKNNPIFGCGMAEHLHLFLTSKDTPKLSIYVGHRSNPLVINFVLGLHPPTPEGFNSTLLTSYNANWTVGLFTNGSDHLVGVYLNETITPICTGPGGEKLDYCPLDQFVAILEGYLNEYTCSKYRCGPNGEPQDVELPFCFSGPAWFTPK